MRIATLLAAVASPPATMPAPAEDDWTPYIILIVSFVVFVVSVIIAAVIVDQKRPRTSQKIIAACAAVIAVASLVGIVGSLTVGGGAAGSDQSAYQLTVKRWLAADYGIPVNDDGSQTLIDGKQLDAKTRVGDRIITLVPTADGHLAVQLAGGEILHPTR